MDWLTNWVFELLYGLQKTICYIIDFVQEIFYTLAGIDKVNIDGEETDLLSHFTMSDTVKTSFFYIFLIATILLVVFVMIAIIRSEYAHGDNKRSKGQILGKAFQSFAIFLMVPFILLAGITLTKVVGDHAITFDEFVTIYNIYKKYEGFSTLKMTKEEQAEFEEYVRKIEQKR